MKKAFVKRVMREGVVDTRTYRYIYVERGNTGVIGRILLRHLGTTAANFAWEVVKLIGWE